MNSQTVEITSAGIRKILNKYTPERAIAEYVWNGFDAKATVVNIDFEIDNAELDTIKNIRITDNGTGICYEELPIKFKKFYESQKRIANYNPQIQISAESETKRSIFREKDKTKRSKKESAQHSKSRNKSFVMTSVSAL